MRLQAMIRGRILAARYSFIRGWVLKLQVGGSTLFYDAQVHIKLCKELNTLLKGNVKETE